MGLDAASIIVDIVHSDMRNLEGRETIAAALQMLALAVGAVSRVDVLAGQTGRETVGRLWLAAVYLKCQAVADRELEVAAQGMCSALAHATGAPSFAALAAAHAGPMVSDLLKVRGRLSLRKGEER